MSTASKISLPATEYIRHETKRTKTKVTNDLPLGLDSDFVMDKVPTPFSLGTIFVREAIQRDYIRNDKNLDFHYQVQAVRSLEWYTSDQTNENRFLGFNQTFHSFISVPWEMKATLDKIFDTIIPVDFASPVLQEGYASYEHPVHDYLKLIWLLDSGATHFDPQAGFQDLIEKVLNGKGIFNFTVVEKPSYDIISAIEIMREYCTRLFGDESIKEIENYVGFDLNDRNPVAFLDSEKLESIYLYTDSSNQCYVHSYHSSPAKRLANIVKALPSHKLLQELNATRDQPADNSLVLEIYRDHTQKSLLDGSSVKAIPQEPHFGWHYSGGGRRVINIVLSQAAIDKLLASKRTHPSRKLITEMDQALYKVISGDARLRGRN